MSQNGSGNFNESDFTGAIADAVVEEFNSSKNVKERLAAARTLMGMDLSDTSYSVEAIRRKIEQATPLKGTDSSYLADPNSSILAPAGNNPTLPIYVNPDTMKDFSKKIPLKEEYSRPKSVLQTIPEEEKKKALNDFNNSVNENTPSGVKPSSSSVSISARKDFVNNIDVEMTRWVDYNPAFDYDSITAVVSKFKEESNRINTKDDRAIVSYSKNTRAVICVSKNIGASDTGDTVRFYQNFILTSVSESKAEAYQLIETLGKDMFYTIGARPMIATISGVLLDSSSHKWKTEFDNDYDEVFRAEKCIQNNERVYVIYKNTAIEGLVLNFSTATVARRPNDSDFNMSMYITNRKHF